MLHLIKLCVGCSSVSALRQEFDAEKELWNDVPSVRIRTRNMPRRMEELQQGGSLYWVIQGEVLCRQRILGCEPVIDAQGQPSCRIILQADVIPTSPIFWRPFQGWRYLKLEDAPPDLGDAIQGGLPPELALELRRLGL